MADNTRLNYEEDDFIDKDELYKPNFQSNHDGTNRGTINHEISKDFANLDADYLPPPETRDPDVWKRVNSELQGLGVIPQTTPMEVINPRSSLDTIMQYLPHPPNIFKSVFGQFWFWIVGGVISFIFVFFPAYWWGTKSQRAKKTEMTMDESINYLKYNALPPLPEPNK